MYDVYGREGLAAGLQVGSLKPVISPGRHHCIRLYTSCRIILLIIHLRCCHPEVVAAGPHFYLVILSGNCSVPACPQVGAKLAGREELKAEWERFQRQRVRWTLSQAEAVCTATAVLRFDWPLMGGDESLCGLMLWT